MKKSILKKLILGNTLFLNLTVFDYVLAERTNTTAAAFGMLFFSAFFFIWITFAVIFLLGFILWIWILVDCIKRDFKNENEKLLWILILIFAHWIGALIYYFLVKRKYNK